MSRRRRRRHSPHDFQRLAEQHQQASGEQLEEIAEIEKCWDAILRTRNLNRLGFDIRHLSWEVYQDLWYQFLCDRYQQRCTARESWTRFDRRLDDALGPELLERLRGQF